MGHTLLGTWRFDSMELWDREAIDLLGPSFLTITADGMGSFRFIAVEGHIDCRFDAQGALPLVEFTWDGFDENRPVSGRGWVRHDADGSAVGRIFLHLGDDSGFTLTR